MLAKQLIYKEVAMHHSIKSTPSPNKVWFVSRHQASLKWIKSEGIMIDHAISHLTSDTPIKAGDIVIGSLPVNKIAQLNQQGVRFISLELDMKPQHRGVELTEQQLPLLNARLQEYLVLRVDPTANSN